MAIVARTFETDGTTHLHDPAELAVIIERTSDLVWVDVHDPTDDDFACLTQEFGLHPLAVEDALKHGQRPKLEHYANHSFLVAYSREMAEVDLFIGPSWFITVRENGPEGQVCKIEAMRSRFERDSPQQTTVGHFVYVVLDEIVDGYLDRTDQIEERVEDIEERILLDQVPDPKDIQVELISLRRELTGFRKVVLPLRDVLVRIQRGEVESIDAIAREQLQDVVDHAFRVIDHLDQERELIAYAVDAHQSLIANRQNQVMKRMTSWGAILIASTLIAGIYGMIFQHMPELGWQYGYAWALGTMGACTLLLYRYFRKKDWL
jgi:magnesium transporter